MTLIHVLLACLCQNYALSPVMDLPTINVFISLVPRDQRPRAPPEALLLPCRDCKPALRQRKTAGIRPITGNLG
jgi:hypothetical protein